MTTTHVDVDLVLTVAGELRRLCQRAAKAGVRYAVFKQESWDTALAPVTQAAARDALPKDAGGVGGAR